MLTFKSMEKTDFINTTIAYPSHEGTFLIPIFLGLCVGARIFRQSDSHLSSLGLIVLPGSFAYTKQ